MVEREAVIKAAKDFLMTVGEAAKKELGPKLIHEQHSEWKVKISPNSWNSYESTRNVIDRQAISMKCQDLMHRGTPAQGAVIDMLENVGVTRETVVHHGFLTDLVEHWVKLPDPLSFEEHSLTHILNEFADAAIDGKFIVRSRDVIDPLTLPRPIDLETGIHLRPISEDELWELGDTSLRWPFNNLPSLPYTEWCVVEIATPHPVDLRDSQIRDYRRDYILSLREAVFTALVLVSEGTFQAGPIVSYKANNYGMHHIQPDSTRRFRIFSRWNPHTAPNESSLRLLKESWGEIKGILTSQSHYLRLPAQRLVDGGCRERPDDAIVDYTTGLESLLTRGAESELSYRFALRGATVLAWDDAGSLPCAKQDRTREPRKNAAKSSRVNPNMSDWRESAETLLVVVLQTGREILR